ncbi:MAG: hypothetical protein ACXW05_05085 [Gemmatirosa sp.]
MERNPNDSLSGGAGGASGSTGPGTGASALGSGTDSISVTGMGAGQNASSGSTGAGGDVGSIDLGASGSGTAGGSAQERLSNAREVAGEKFGNAREVAGEKLGQAKEKASQLKATLADKLEAGANSLRQPSPGGTQQFAGANGATTDGNPQMAQLRTTGADAMQKTAEFLRSGDLRGTVEEQMRTNPGRTLLIAVGLGYVLGKAIRGGDRR